MPRELTQEEKTRLNHVVEGIKQPQGGLQGMLGPLQELVGFLEGDTNICHAVAKVTPIPATLFLVVRTAGSEAGSSGDSDRSNPQSPLSCALHAMKLLVGHGHTRRSFEPLTGCASPSVAISGLVRALQSKDVATLDHLVGLVRVILLEEDADKFRKQWLSAMMTEGGDEEKAPEQTGSQLSIDLFEKELLSTVEELRHQQGDPMKLDTIARRIALIAQLAIVLTLGNVPFQQALTSSPAKLLQTAVVALDRVLSVPPTQHLQSNETPSSFIVAACDLCVLLHALCNHNMESCQELLHNPLMKTVTEQYLLPASWSFSSAKDPKQRQSAVLLLVSLLSTAAKSEEGFHLLQDVLGGQLVHDIMSNDKDCEDVSGSPMVELKQLMFFAKEVDGALNTMRHHHLDTEQVASALETLWGRVEDTPSHLHDACRFVMNVSHGTAFMRSLVLGLANVDELVSSRACKMLTFAIADDPDALRAFVAGDGVSLLQDVLFDYEDDVLASAAVLLKHLSQSALGWRQILDTGMISRVEQIVEQLAERIAGGDASGDQSLLGSTPPSPSTGLTAVGKMCGALLEAIGTFPTLNVFPRNGEALLAALHSMLLVCCRENPREYLYLSPLVAKALMKLIQTSKSADSHIQKLCTTSATVPVGFVDLCASVLQDLPQLVVEGKRGGGNGLAGVHLASSTTTALAELVSAVIERNPNTQVQALGHQQLMDVAVEGVKNAHNIVWLQGAGLRILGAIATDNPNTQLSLVNSVAVEGVVVGVEHCVVTIEQWAQQQLQCEEGEEAILEADMVAMLRASPSLLKQQLSLLSSLYTSAATSDAVLVAKENDKKELNTHHAELLSRLLSALLKLVGLPRNIHGPLATAAGLGEDASMHTPLTCVQFITSLLLIPPSALSRGCNRFAFLEAILPLFEHSTPYLIHTIQQCEEANEDDETATMAANHCFKLLMGPLAQFSIPSLMQLGNAAIEGFFSTTSETPETFDNSLQLWAPLPIPTDVDDAHDVLVAIVPLLNGVLHHDSHSRVVAAKSNTEQFFSALLNCHQRLELPLRVLALYGLWNMMSLPHGAEDIALKLTQPSSSVEKDGNKSFIATICEGLFHEITKFHRPTTAGTSKQEQAATTNEVKDAIYMTLERVHLLLNKLPKAERPAFGSIFSDSILSNLTNDAKRPCQRESPTESSVPAEADCKSAAGLLLCILQDDVALGLIKEKVSSRGDGGAAPTSPSLRTSLLQALQNIKDDAVRTQRDEQHSTKGTSAAGTAASSTSSSTASSAPGNTNAAYVAMQAGKYLDEIAVM